MRNTVSLNELKNNILAILYNANETDAAIEEVLSLVGAYFGVDRVYIFENSEDNLCCSNTFEWCNDGITPEKDHLQNMRYLEDMGGEWMKNYDKDGLFFCPSVKNLPDIQREVLEAQGITSMLQCAVMERGDFKGYIGFDNCQTHLKGWENDQSAVDSLVFISRLLTIYLLEYRNKSKLIENTQKQIQAEEIKNRQLAEALDAAQNATRAKSEFLAKMSHEIRTPMNAIIGYLSIAEDSDRNVDTLMHCISNSQIAARELLQIINDILDMSSIESGKIKIAYEVYDLKRELQDITTIFYQNSKNKGITFETHIDGLSEEWVFGDQLRTNQVLMNLLSNAVKFTPEGGSVQLYVKQLDLDDEKVYLRFRVSDTGIGMSPEYMARLFQPFEQEDAVTARKYGGSGLGLSIANNLVSMMGGNIEVDSVQGQGTTFTVTMPFGRSDRQPEEPAKPIDFSHIHALIVDDRKDDGSYVKAMLKRCGVKADSVTSGRDALKRLRGRMGTEYHYDLCIIDWSMPEMDGKQVTAAIRAEFGNQIPIVIATAYDITLLEAQAKAAGANRVMAKPLFQSTLFDLLVTTFGGYDPAANKKPEKQKVNMHGLRVLLAEDNPMNMDIAMTVLKKAGVVVEPAVNGEEAVEKFLSASPKTYDLILMDVQMPILDGYEATRQIRRSDHPEAKRIPIVAMTANAFAEDVADALACGMNAHISKPVNYNKLFAVLKDCTKGERGGQA